MIRTLTVGGLMSLALTACLHATGYEQPIVIGHLDQVEGYWIVGYEEGFFRSCAGELYQLYHERSDWVEYDVDGGVALPVRLSADILGGPSPHPQWSQAPLLDNADFVFIRPPCAPPAGYWFWEGS